MQSPDEGPRISLRQLLQVMIQQGASDLHITTGTPPQLRIDGSLTPLRTPPLGPVETKFLCYEVMTEEQKIKFEKNNELDFSFGVKGLSRFRANVFMQRGAIAGAFRAIPFKIRSLDDLGLPQVIKELCDLPRGLVLVTGPTGSGKSTTLAAMIDKINSERREHIMTVEDPIEYLHMNKLCVVNQREIGADTNTFKGALKYVLRQDPDVVLVGEMRDLETIEAAMTISETGHLVFATLHTNSAVQSINRVIDVFPPHQQPQIRAQLSFVLQGVVTQMLLPRPDGPGRSLAAEIMIPNYAIRNLIRENKVHQIYGIMQTGQGASGMQTMNQALYKLYRAGHVSLDEAMARSLEPAELQTMIEQNVNVQSGERRPR
ncbi:MAG: type IV pilus twitching motility protein PilT [Myxococcota bacterium]|jgi:twitching motility protein PilT|nr:type IV pilus twitching motility protein PilT [Myxococcota bacterium]